MDMFMLNKKCIGVCVGVLTVSSYAVFVSIPVPCSDASGQLTNNSTQTKVVETSLNEV